MRLHAVLCVRNEESRYLQSHLEWHRGQFDSTFVYDDASDDGTLDLLRLYGEVMVQSRPATVPSFLEHEGKFRKGAFDAFVKKVRPSPGDWVVALDADEFLVADYSSLYQSLNVATRAAEDCGAASLMLHIPEVWSLAPLDVRIDGFWNGNSHPRIFRYLPPVEFKDKKMGCGSWPTYVDELDKHPCSILRIMHFGYAKDEDRQDKYRRYSSQRDHGHNTKHIESILETPILSPWSGATPKVWRGIRG